MSRLSRAVTKGCATASDLRGGDGRAQRARGRWQRSSFTVAPKGDVPHRCADARPNGGEPRTSCAQASDWGPLRQATTCNSQASVHIGDVPRPLPPKKPFPVQPARPSLCPPATPSSGGDAVPLHRSSVRQCTTCTACTAPEVVVHGPQLVRCVVRHDRQLVEGVAAAGHHGRSLTVEPNGPSPLWPRVAHHLRGRGAGPAGLRGGGSRLVAMKVAQAMVRMAPFEGARRGSAVQAPGALQIHCQSVQRARHNDPARPAGRVSNL